jgi:hypothetical protein
MPTIKVLGDTITIDKTFVSGKDRIRVNGQEVFSGKLNKEKPQTFQAGRRQYTLETRTVSQWTGAVAYYLDIFEGDQQLHSGIYDQAGKPVRSEGQASATALIHGCGAVGGVIGFMTMMVLSHSTGVVPGGAIGGAIGGGGGYMLGYGLGTLLFGRRS